MLPFSADRLDLVVVIFAASVTTLLSFENGVARSNTRPLLASVEIIALKVPFATNRNFLQVGSITAVDAARFLNPFGLTRGGTDFFQAGVQRMISDVTVQGDDVSQQVHITIVVAAIDAASVLTVITSSASHFSGAFA